MQSDNESLHHGVSHKPGRPDFWKNSQIIRRNMRLKKRLVVAEKTKFISMKQEIDEPIIKYLHRLGNASRYREFENLDKKNRWLKRTKLN